MRLDRYLSNMGLGTRKEIAEAIRSGRVSVDGKLVLQKDAEVREGTSSVEMDGRTVAYKPHVYIMLNKPEGYISSTEDGSGPVVTELLTPELARYVPAPAGRLDKDAVGLLLLTSDGEFIHRVITPKKHVPKVYYVRLKKAVTPEDEAAFKAGIVLKDGTALLPANLTRTTDPSTGAPAAFVTVYEGKFHQVKRMFLSRDNEVRFLKRVAIGALKLDRALAPGEYKELSREEAEKVFEKGDGNGAETGEENE